MNARALHEQQTQAARRRRTTSALRRGKLVHALSPTYSIARAHTISPAGQAHQQDVAQAGPYTAPELRTWLRPGADDHERYPSRMGNVRLWRDGRREVAA